MKKKLLILLSALCLCGMLCGCEFSLEEFVGKVTEVVDIDALIERMTSFTAVTVNEPKNSDDIIADLPAALTSLTVGDRVEECEVTHLAITERETDMTRQVDNVTAYVELVGSGISVNYTCELEYAFTSYAGWTLTDWTLNADTLTMGLTDGALTDAMAADAMSDLEETYGSDSVTFVSTEWDSDSQSCISRFTIASSNGSLVTDGAVTITSTLRIDPSQGLYYYCHSNIDDSGLTYGADLSGSVWLCDGTVNGYQQLFAVRIEDFSLSDNTAVVSAYSLTFTAAYGYSSGQVNSETETWSNGSDGAVIISFTTNYGATSWDCCFGSDEQWVRKDGEYLDVLTRQDNSADLYELVTNSMTERWTSSSITYATASDGKSYTTSDGTEAYLMKASYPTFSGTNAYYLNILVDNIVNDFFDDPGFVGSKENMDVLQKMCEENNTSFPITDKLDMTVEFSKNGYVSVLATITRKDQDGVSSYEYKSITYNIDTGAELAQSDFLYGTPTDLGTCINSHAANVSHSDATVESYVQAWVLSDSGIVFYVTVGSNGSCDVITVPYSDAYCYTDPTK